MNARNAISRQKHADLSSSAGAGILGAGLGALLVDLVRPEIWQPVAAALVGIGIILHGWGMLEKRRLEAGVEAPGWSTALYWLCWAGLATLVIWLGLAAFKD